ncbi:hypothetical protein [Nosocomiicoccus sp. HMSC059G07]|uniref:hypothetical protein n=1 Tax=Nosocomiicoccus sp. HMSC059G07 TaxID=1739531 RepID=UPI0008A6471F|nr:hypothetical protein [Nosocomiicoccus sp. HMSC059G07]OFO55297.1 hypothetical protein HMPREF3029_04570 [Nosocomiicoccus sp. HMSC059G07]
MNNKKVLFFIVGVVLVFTVPFFLLNKNIKSLQVENKYLKDELNILEKEKQSMEKDIEIVEVEKEDNDESEQSTLNDNEMIEDFSLEFVNLMFNRLNNSDVEKLKDLTESEATTFLERRGYFKSVDDNSNIPKSNVEEIKVYTKDITKNKKDVVIVYGTKVDGDSVTNYGIYHLEVEIKTDGSLIATNMYGDNPLMNPEIELFFGKEAVDQ